MNISVLGAGAWGTAVALALTAKNQVLLWGRNSLAMAALQSQRENHAYLPGFRFPEQLQISAELDAAEEGAHGPGRQASP